jgi:hypothetical protein
MLEAAEVFLRCLRCGLADNEVAKEFSRWVKDALEVSEVCTRWLRCELDDYEVLKLA